MVEFPSDAFDDLESAEGGTDEQAIMEWMNRMLRSEDADTAMSGAEAAQSRDGWEDFVRDRLSAERGAEPSDAMMGALEKARSSLLDADVFTEARIIRGRSATIFRDVTTGRFVGFGNVLNRLRTGRR